MPPIHDASVSMVSLVDGMMPTVCLAWLYAHCCAVHVQTSLESEEPQRGISAANPMYLRRMRMMMKASEPPKPREEKIHPFCPWKVSGNKIISSLHFGLNASQE